MKKRKWLIVLVALIAVLGIVYALGPKPAKPDFSKLTYYHAPADLMTLQDSINRAEAALPLKPDNEARIIWADSMRMTEYAMVYLPGNGASQEEGDPIHEALAHRYGCNLFLARPYGHGLQGSDPMLNMDPVAWMQSALDAIAVGYALGEKVILVSCSTGSTLGLFLQSQFPDIVTAHIMLSPNVDVFDPRSGMLTQPWGLQIARVILGGKYYGWDAPTKASQYWYTKYRAEGLVSMMNMIRCTMKEANFRKISTPVCMAYYYKDDDHQDHVVSVKRMREMYSQLGTPVAEKSEIALQEAGTHIIGSDLFNTHLDELWPPLTNYCEQVLHLVPVDSTDWRPFLDKR